jgi:hypothetical protein
MGLPFDIIQTKVYAIRFSGSEDKTKFKRDGQNG